MAAATAGDTKVSAGMEFGNLPWKMTEFSL